VTSEVASSASSEVDRAYSDHSLAELYDLLNPWGPSDEFYLGLTMSAASVLDVGCGTGALSTSQPGPTAAKPTSRTSPCSAATTTDNSNPPAEPATPTTAPLVAPTTLD